MKSKPIETSVVPPVPTLILTAGAKGGLGKTWSLALIADWLASRGMPFVPIDCDLENHGKNTSFGHYFPPKEAGQLDLRDEGDRSRLFSNALENEVGLTLADLPANSGPDFLSWWKRLNLTEELSGLGLRVIVVGLVTSESGTFDGFLDWVEVMQASVSYVVVLNRRDQARSEQSIGTLMPEYFGAFGERFRETFKPIEIELPGLHDETMNVLRNTGKLPSLAASPSVGLDFFLRLRINALLKATHPRFDQHLLPLLRP